MANGWMGANDSYLKGSRFSGTPHTQFWFDDGSIVLSADSTLFRVHRSILCMHSRIFADMFMVPQPLQDESQPIIDGCPVVQMPDKAVDLTDLLRALYEPLKHFDSLSPDADVDTTMTFVSGILRLSTKYCMTQLREKSIDILKQKIPCTLSDFLSTRSEYLRHHHDYPPSTRIRIINLARETNVPELLPFAFYQCARLDCKLLLNGTYSDVLSWRDKAICFAGRERLIDAQKTYTHSFLVDFKPSPACLRPGGCGFPSRGRNFNWDLLRNFFRVPQALEPLNLNLWDPPIYSFCRRCEDNLQAEHRKGWGCIWEMLPGIFELGSWEEIRKTQCN